MADHDEKADWTPPRTPNNWRPEHLPFRRAHRLPVHTGADVVSPGHPGRASAAVLDVSEQGVFIEDEAHSFAAGDDMRIGLHVPGTAQPVWAEAKVRWRGAKQGRAGCGVRLRFDGDRQQGIWCGAVSRWMGSQTSA